MTAQEIQAEINKLEADNAAMSLKIYGVGLLGSIAGVVLASKQGRTFWGKLGFFLTGGVIARTPMVMLYAKKIADNAAAIENLQLQLPKEPSLYDQLTEQYSQQ